VNAWCRLIDGLIGVQQQFQHKTAYIVPLISMLQLKIENNKKNENVTCWECIQ